MNPFEECWVLIGKIEGVLWHGRARHRTTGDFATVGFDSKWVLNREENRGDVIGFVHTHPGMTAYPSSRDLKTMETWVDCFGKDLVCIINGIDGIRAYIFSPDNDPEMEEVQVGRFDNGFFGITVPMIRCKSCGDLVPLEESDGYLCDDCIEFWLDEDEEDDDGD